MFEETRLKWEIGRRERKLGFRRGNEVGIGVIVLGAAALVVVVGCFAVGLSSEKGTSQTSLKPTRQIAAADPKTPSGHKIDMDEGRSLLKAIASVTGPCDRAFGFTNQALNANNMQNLYHNSQVGKALCMRAESQVSDIQVPAHATDEAQASIKEALIELDNAYSSEQVFMDRLGGFANEGFTRPSEIETYRQDYAEAMAHKQHGAVEIADALKAEGADQALAVAYAHAHHCSATF